MAAYKDEAIVLHAHDLGEADRIVSLITAGHGLRRAVVKGVKRTGSRFGARLEPFTHLKVVLHQGRNLDTVTQADIIHAHSGIRGDFEKFLYGEAMLELVEKSLQENQTIPRLFDILRVTLQVLEGEAKLPALLLAAFQLKVCAIIGYRPQLDRCLHCGRVVGKEASRLDLSEGGIICTSCGEGFRHGLTISPEGLELMRCLMREEMAAVALREEVPRLVREMIRVSFPFTEHVLERQLKSRRIVLNHLERGNATVCASHPEGLARYEP